MKFMKLGSKPDSFQADGDNIRYVATELATDVVINVGDVKFYLHKFPLLSKSARLQKLIATSNEESNTGDEIHIPDFPGGSAAFQICAKFCYGITVTLNAYNVVSARCAAEYLEMYETVEKGNLVYKIEVFLNSSIFRSWKDSILVLQTTKSLLPWSEELKVVSRCLDSIASKASMDTSRVEWSYTYNRKKLPSEDRVIRMSQTVPKDWWVEDLCELHIDLYKQVISSIKTKDRVPSDILGEALNAYAMRKIPDFSKGLTQSSDLVKYRSLLETIIWLVPTEKRSVSSSFLIKLLRAAITLDCGEKERNELTRRIGQQLESATVGDLLIREPGGTTTVYNVDIVQSLVEEFVTEEQRKVQMHCSENGLKESNAMEFVSDGSKVTVAKLIDGYLVEIARDPNLPVSKFLALADAVSSFPRKSHDGVYRAIDMFLKEHPGITKSERKRICRLMDCRKLSSEASAHAVQNERLPLRVIVQVLFFEQIRATTTSTGCTLPDLPGPVKALLPGSDSHGSLRSSTTNTEDDWDSVTTAEDINRLRGEIGETGSEKLGSGNNSKGLVVSKMMFSRLWSGKDKNGDQISSSDTSESPGSATAEDKSTPSTSRRRSMS